MSRRKFVAGLGVTVLASVAGCTEPIEDFVSGPSVEEVKNNAERVPYETLYRNISDYEGSYVHYPNLYIIDVVSGEGTKEYLLGFNDSGFNDDKILYDVWEGDPFREDDDVEIWGVVRGMRSYNSLTGERTVPEVQIKAMRVVQRV